MIQDPGKVLPIEVALLITRKAEDMDFALSLFISTVIPSQIAPSDLTCSL
jgi:hypothetical protein